MMKDDEPRHFRAGPILVAAALLLTTACGDGRLKTYPVSGKVLVDGKPAAGARIVLHPIEGGEIFMQQRPFTFCKEDGSFSLTTFRKGDGAAEGKYRVAIKWSGGGQGGRGGDTPPGRRRVPDRLKGRYAKPATSGLTADVPSGGKEFTFELSTK